MLSNTIIYNGNSFFSSYEENRAVCKKERLKYWISFFGSPVYVTRVYRYINKVVSKESVINKSTFN